MTTLPRFRFNQSMIKIATAGFSFKSWVGPVYPQGLTPAQYLPYYYRTLGFDTVEIDASYYAYLGEKTVHAWLEKTDENFSFVVKLHKDLTLNESREYPLKAVGRAAAERFAASVLPLKENRRLTALLAQFGPLFARKPEHEKYLADLRECLPEFPLLVEFRHPSWLKPEQREATFDFLRRNNLGYVAADLPANLRLPELTPQVVGEIACLRLHGRNPNWFKADRDERYNYNYRDEELRSFIPLIKEMEKKALVTLVTFNNCHGGNALVNALKLKKFLGLLGPVLLKREELPGL